MAGSGSAGRREEEEGEERVVTGGDDMLAASTVEGSEEREDSVVTGRTEDVVLVSRAGSITAETYTYCTVHESTCTNVHVHVYSILYTK